MGGAFLTNVRNLGGGKMNKNEKKDVIASLSRSQSRQPEPAGRLRHKHNFNQRGAVLWDERKGAACLNIT